MSQNVETNNITDVRNELHDLCKDQGVTVITRSGEFAGVFISPGEVRPGVRKQLQRTIERNPEHGIGVLTKQATD